MLPSSQQQQLLLLLLAEVVSGQKVFYVSPSGVQSFDLATGEEAEFGAPWASPSLQCGGGLGVDEAMSTALVCCGKALYREDLSPVAGWNPRYEAVGVAVDEQRHLGYVSGWRAGEGWALFAVDIKGGGAAVRPEPVMKLPGGARDGGGVAVDAEGAAWLAGGGKVASHAGSLSNLSYPPHRGAVSAASDRLYLAAEDGSLSGHLIPPASGGVVTFPRPFPDPQVGHIVVADDGSVVYRNGSELWALRAGNAVSISPGVAGPIALGRPAALPPPTPAPPALPPPQPPLHQEEEGGAGGTQDITIVVVILVLLGMLCCLVGVFFVTKLRDSREEERASAFAVPVKKPPETPLLLGGGGGGGGGECVRPAESPTPILLAPPVKRKKREGRNPLNDLPTVSEHGSDPGTPTTPFTSVGGGGKTSSAGGPQRVGRHRARTAAPAALFPPRTVSPDSSPPSPALTLGRRGRGNTRFTATPTTTSPPSSADWFPSSTSNPQTPSKPRAATRYTRRTVVEIVT